MKAFHRSFGYLAVLLAACTFYSCTEDESYTFNGKVIDLDTNKSIVSANVDLIISDGFGPSSSFRNPVKTTTATDFQGYYSFTLPSIAENKVHSLLPHKEGYVTDPSYLATIIKDKNDVQHDLYLAKGSFLNITIKKTSTLNAGITKVELTSKVSKTDHINGSIYQTERVDFGVLLMDTSLTRGYYFKAAPTVEVSWHVLTDGVVQVYKQVVPLIEYDTAHFTINY